MQHWRNNLYPQEVLMNGDFDHLDNLQFPEDVVDGFEWIEPQEPVVHIDEPQVPQVSLIEPLEPEVKKIEPQEHEAIIIEHQEHEVIIIDPQQHEVIIIEPQEPEVMILEPQEPEVINIEPQNQIALENLEPIDVESNLNLNYHPNYELINIIN